MRIIVCDRCAKIIDPLVEGCSSVKHEGRVFSFHLSCTRWSWSKDAGPYIDIPTDRFIIGPHSYERREA